MQWLSNQRFHAVAGQLALVGKVYAFSSWANMNIFCLAAIPLAANYRHTHVRSPLRYLRGRIVKSLWCMNGPMQGLASRTFQAAVGQLELIGEVSAFASWATASSFLSSHLAN